VYALLCTHMQVRSLGDALRATGDTVAGLTGGSIKTIGATVQGVAAALDSTSASLASKTSDERAAAAAHSKPAWLADDDDSEEGDEDVEGNYPLVTVTFGTVNDETVIFEDSLLYRMACLLLTQFAAHALQHGCADCTSTVSRLSSLLLTP
jgi:hypothetical protein